MKMSSKTYDVLKYIAQIALPALGTCYGALALLWKLPYISEIEGTVLAVDTLLGSLLKISTNQYNASLISEDTEDVDL